MSGLAHVKAQSRDITVHLLPCGTRVSRWKRRSFWASLLAWMALQLLTSPEEVQAATPAVLSATLPFRAQIEPLQFSEAFDAQEHGPWQRVEGQFVARSTSGPWTWARSALNEASFALIPSDSALVLLTLPAGAREKLTLEWVSGGQLERDLLPHLPRPLPDTLTDLRLRLAARSEAVPSSVTQASLSLRLWPSEPAPHPAAVGALEPLPEDSSDTTLAPPIPALSLAFELGDHLLVRVPPGPGVLRGAFSALAPRGRGVVQAWEAAPEQSQERWWTFDEALEQWARAWPAQLVPPTPPPPTPAAWTELQLWSQVLAGETVPAKQAQALLLTMAQQKLLTVRKPSTLMYQVTDLTSETSKILREQEGASTPARFEKNAGRWVPGDSHSYLSLEAGDEVTLPLEGEGLAALSVLARLSESQTAGMSRLTVALGEAPGVPLVLRARAAFAAPGTVLRSSRGEVLSSPRSLSLVVRPADGALRVRVADPVLLSVRFHSPSPTLLALNRVPTQRGLLDSILSAFTHPWGAGRPVPWMRGMALALQGNRLESLQVLSDEIHQSSSPLQALLSVQCARLASDEREAQRWLEQALAGTTPELSTPPWRSWLEGARIELAGLRGDTAGTWTALEQDSGDKLPAFTRGVMPILAPEWRAEWQRDRLSAVLASLYEQQPDARDIRQALVRRISSESRWKPLLPEINPLQQQRDMSVSILTPLGASAQEACSQTASVSGQSSSKTLYQSLPKRFPLDVTLSGRPGWESSDTSIHHSVRFYLASSGRAVQVSLGIDGHWRTLSPLRSLERFELSLTPGKHRIQWESAWPVQLLMEQLPGTSVVVNPLPDGTDKATPSREMVPCEGLHTITRLWSLSLPQTYAVPESTLAGFARIEISELLTQDAKNTPISNQDDSATFYVLVGNSVYTLRYQRGTFLPPRLHDRGSRFLVTDSARLIVPIPAGTHQIRVIQNPKEVSAISATHSFLTQVSILAPEDTQDPTLSEEGEEVLVKKEAHSSVNPVSSRMSFEDAARLQELSRLSNALRETPAEKRGSLHLARGERLALLQQSDLAELELITALVRGVTPPERARAHSLLRGLEERSQWQALSWQAGAPSPFDHSQEPLLSLPDDPDPAELDLTPVWKLMRAEEWQAARVNLEKLERRFPSAWKLLWMRVHVLRELGATVEEARGWSKLALRSPRPGPLWVESARAYLRALEDTAQSPSNNASHRVSRELERNDLPQAERDRWALEGYAAASQAVLAGGEEGERLRARLGRFSRWRSLLHVERSAGVETLALTAEGLERGLRSRAQEALLGVPWPASEGVIADTQTLASATLRFQHATAIRLDLFCTFEGGVENDQGDQAVIAGPCDASVKVDGAEQASASVPVGQLRRLDLGSLQGRHTLEISLEDATLDRRLAVRVWSEQGGAVASRLPPEGEALSGERPMGWNPVAVTPRRKGFVASPLEPVRLTLEGPNWLQVEGRRRIADPSRSDQNLLGLEVQLRSVTTGDTLEREPQTGPSPMDPSARLEGRVRSQVGSPVRMELPIPAGVWEIVVVPTQRAIVSMRVRESLEDIESGVRNNSPLEPIPGSIERKTRMTFLQPPPSLQMPSMDSQLPLTTDVQLSLISTQSLQELNFSEDASTEDTEKTDPSMQASATSSVLEAAQIEAVDWTMTGRIRHHSEREGGIVPQWSAISALIQGETPFLALEGAASQMQPSIKGMGLRLQYVYPLMHRHLRLTGEHSLFAQYQSGGQYPSDASGSTGTEGDAWGARHLSRVELSGLMRMAGSFRFRPSLGLIMRSLHVGTGLLTEESQAAINTLDPYFQAQYPVTHPNALYLQGEVFARPLADMYCSVRTRLNSNPLILSGRDANGDEVVQRGLERVEMRALVSMLIGRVELEPQLRFESGIPDELRTDFTPSLTLGTAVRTRLALGAGARLELGADARYEVLSQDVYLGLTLGGVLHRGRGSRDALPGQERFAEFHDRKDVIGSANTLKD